MRRWVLVLIAGVTGCGGESGAEAAGEEVRADVAGEATFQASCSVASPSTPLPDELRETSGLAQSRRDPELFWTHNDGNGAELFGIGADGSIIQRVEIPGTEFDDWEDVEAGACASGTCLFLADIGDNDGERENITVYRIPEPAAGARASASPVALRARYPERAQDAEALIVSDVGEIYIVTKGRTGPIRLYQLPIPTAEGVATLELVEELMPEPENDRDRITAGTLSRDGRWVGIRSYTNLYLYEAASFFSSSADQPQVIDLSAARQENGESLVISAEGSIWVTSEAGGDDSSPEWARFECDLGR